MARYRLRAVFRDWRFWTSFAATLTAACLAFALVSKDQRERDAQHNLQKSIAAGEASRERASARITSLQAEIAHLAGQAETNGQRIGELLAEVAALQEQVRQLGGRPVIASPSSSSPSGSPATTTTTQPRSPPTTSPRPTCTTVPVVGVCLP